MQVMLVQPASEPTCRLCREMFKQTSESLWPGFREIITLHSISMKRKYNFCFVLVLQDHLPKRGGWRFRIDKISRNMAGKNRYIERN